MGSESAVESQAGRWITDLSRRAFLRRGALTAAAVGVVGSVPGMSGLLAGASSEAPAIATSSTEAEPEVAALTEPLVVHVTDSTTGEISLYRGAQEIVVRDPVLVRHLIAASRP